jgi:hypothetical protein
MLTVPTTKYCHADPNLPLTGTAAEGLGVAVDCVFPKEENEEDEEEEEVGSAGVNSSWHSSFSASSSPAKLVTAIGRHENPSASTVRVTVFVSRVVVGMVEVTVVLTVVYGVHKVCRGNRSASARALRAALVALVTLVVMLTALLPLPVVSGGEYSSPQSSPSSRTAPSLFVAVIGMQENSGASSGSAISVAVIVTVVVIIGRDVRVSVWVAAGQAEHKPFAAQ